MIPRYVKVEVTTISIITATYNAASTVADCLRSVVSQTHPAEQIDIDGASTDAILEAVHRNKRICWYLHAD